MFVRILIIDFTSQDNKTSQNQLLSIFKKIFFIVRTLVVYKLK